MTSIQSSIEGRLLEMQAYTALTQFWVNLEQREDLYEDEAKMFLLLQQSLIEKFERTLAEVLGEKPAREFVDFANRFKVRIVFKEDKTATPYLHRKR